MIRPHYLPLSSHLLLFVSFFPRRERYTGLPPHPTDLQILPFFQRDNFEENRLLFNILKSENKGITGYKTGKTKKTSLEFSYF